MTQIQSHFYPIHKEKMFDFVLKVLEIAPAVSIADDRSGSGTYLVTINIEQLDNTDVIAIEALLP